MSISRRTAIRRQALAGLTLLGLPYAPARAIARAPAELDAEARAPLPLRISAGLAEAAELLAPSALQL